MNIEYVRDKRVALTDYEKAFVGKCMGVGLARRGGERRGEVDPHVTFVILHEDDGNWFESAQACSSYWLPELEEVLAAARVWCVAYCDKDGAYGWMFRR